MRTVLVAVKMHNAIMEFARANARSQEELGDASGSTSDNDGQRGRSSLDAPDARMGGQKREKSASPVRSPGSGYDSGGESVQRKRKRKTTLLGDVWDVLAYRLSQVFVDDHWGMSISFNDMDIGLGADDDDFIGNRCMLCVHIYINV